MGNRNTLNYLLFNFQENLMAANDSIFIKNFLWQKNQKIFTSVLITLEEINNENLLTKDDYNYLLYYKEILQKTAESLTEKLISDASFNLNFWNECNTLDVENFSLKKTTKKTFLIGYDFDFTTLNDLERKNFLNSHRKELEKNILSNILNNSVEKETEIFKYWVSNRFAGLENEISVFDNNFTF